MLSGNWYLWMMGLLSIVALLALVYIAWRALFKDRANGRRRCPRCWYDMAYSPGMTCAECGFTAKRESQFGRTRRRYGQAAIAILGSAVLALWINYRMSEQGWAAVMPTKVLVLAVPLTDRDGDIYLELRRRMVAQDMSDFELGMFIKRCARGDWWARPPQSETEDAWRRKYGYMIHQWRRALVMHGEVTGLARRRLDASAAPYTEIEEYLLDIPPAISLTAPRNWPSDVAPRVQVRLQHWWPAGSVVRLQLMRQDDPENVITLEQGDVRTRRGFALPVEGLAPDATEVTFDVSVSRRRPGLKEPWQQVSVHQFTLPIHITDDPDAWPEPADDEILTNIISEVFQGQVIRWPSGRTRARFRYDPRRTFSTELEDLAVAASVQLKRGDELARQLNIWWVGGKPVESDMGYFEPRGIGWEVVYENHELLAALDDEDETWHFHIQGRPELAQFAGKAKRYWAGSLMIPVQVMDVDTRSPRPQWRRVEEEADE